MTARYMDSFPATRDDYVPARIVESDVKAIHGRYAVVGATVAISDTLYVAKLPSDVRILAVSSLQFDAVAGASDVDFGDSNDPDGLIDGQDITSAGNVSAIKTVDLPNRGKRLWEMLGYASDPGGQLDLYLTFKTEPTGSGDIYVELFYQHQ